MEIEQAVRTCLEEANASCVIEIDGRRAISFDSGIRPLLLWLQEDADCLRGAAAADKIVGRAAALLLAYGGAAYVYGAVMSEGARQVLAAHSIRFDFGKIVESIRNRLGTGMCPMEQRVLEIDEPKKAYETLLAVLQP